MQRRRDPLLLAAAAAAAIVASVAVHGSIAWIGKPFPGFLVLENRVIASAGLAHWPATRDTAIYQQEIASVEGEPLADPSELFERVRAVPPGTQLHYELRDRDGARRVAVATRVFEASDWALLFGSYLGCGLALCALALCILYLRGRDLLAVGSSLALYAAGMWALTAIDLYGPYRLFRLHALFETALAPAALWLGLVFPRPAAFVERRPFVGLALVAAAAPLAIAYQIGLHDPRIYRLAHGGARTGFGVALVLLIGSQCLHWVRSRDGVVRQRVKIVALGSVLALGPQVVLALLAASTGVQAPQNVMAYSGLFFPLSIAYAVLRHNLLDVDEYLRRALNYVVLSACVLGLYAAVLGAFGGALRDSAAWLWLGPVSVLLLLPLRDRAQSAIDRLFFRQHYDFRRVIETASARLASVADLSVISLEIHRAVGDTVVPAWIALHAHASAGSEMLVLDSSCPDPAVEAAMVDRARDEQRPFDGPDGALGVPFHADGRLVAVLLLGRRLSGQPYGGEDRRLLHTLSNQGAVAIDNALALDQLRALNRDLEAKVAERTAELRAALRDLRETQAQLVHREKMASIGQFVAGVAHEMNNPLAFVEGNLYFIDSYVGSISAALAEYEEVLASEPALSSRVADVRERHELSAIAADLASVLEGCREGVARTTSLVRDLKTFSRLDHADVMRVDLREALDSTLNLLRAHLVKREVVREYGDVPPVECLAGQINQVLMNLIANAADATADGGRIVIRVLASDGRIEVEVEDDGCGIAAEDLERVFEPFFTTKEPGRGTGLGLAISYGIVMRHRGSLTVDSEPGRGARFRLVLPLKADLVTDVARA